MLEFLSDPEFWKVASIPVLAALVGWGTNWVAIQLTFLPLEFVGLVRPWLGWQGIIPSKARKMAAVAVESTLSKLGSLRDVYDQIEPEKIAKQILNFIEPRLDAMTAEVVSQSHGNLWASMPAPLKQRIYDRVREELPGRIDALVEDMGDRLEDLISLRDMIMEHAAKNKALLNRIFLECGVSEFRFLIRSGVYFGFAFGLAQMLAWIFYQGPWVLPVFGFVVGCATNWIALNIIFRPLHPMRVGRLELQGLFLKRQDEVAATYSRLVTNEIITVRNLADAMLNGPKSARAHALIRKHLAPIVDDAVGMAKPLVKGVVGAAGIDDFKEHVGETAIGVSSQPFEDPVFNQDRASVIEQIMRERMAELSPEEFVELLRPCFQEDEWKLILLGGALGVAAGVAQLAFVFGGL